MARKAVKAHDPAKGTDVFVGVIEGKTFTRKVDPDLHMLRVRKAYALSDTVIDKLVDENVETVVIQEPTRRLVSNVTDWQDFGQPWDKGHGAQTTLAISFMAVQ